MSAYCEFCHTATGLHLPDCPQQAAEEAANAPAETVHDPYSPAEQPALWGASTKAAPGEEHDAPRVIIHTKR